MQEDKKEEKKVLAAAYASIPPANQKRDEKIIHILKLIVVGILCFSVIVFVFGVGVFVGQKRAEFSFQWAENYHRNFGGPDQGFFNNFPATDFINTHGVFGPIIKIDGNNLVVKDRDNMEKTMVVSPETAIVNGSGIIKVSDLKLGDNIVVIGAPNNRGQIDAKLIRVMSAVVQSFFLKYPYRVEVFNIN